MSNGIWYYCCKETYECHKSDIVNYHAMPPSFLSKYLHILAALMSPDLIVMVARRRHQLREYNLV